MKYAYAAVFHRNEDGTHTVTYPDLPGCASSGDSEETARENATLALIKWIGNLRTQHRAIPKASALYAVKKGANEFVGLISIEMK
ncbi:MAG: type II toxin-antitoxin system HicB family antitoxin [Spirochaetaceae bacterium]|jgi:predicted RNase H-like HicB family nuclease|nr:type II toxin-antitoxin system HicB family antitoxin [Spirochaetaceae bacterium]